MTPILLDHNATGPVDPAVIEAMAAYWGLGGNVESRHALGRRARRAWDESRERIARALDCRADEVVFTSGGTEANNLAVFGLAGDGPARAIASSIEHPAVAEPIARLEERGWAVERPPVGAAGVVELAAWEVPLARGDVRFATLMLANNETGAIQPVSELVRLAEQHGAPVHTDAVQAVGRMPVSFRALGVATLAFSGHKLGGPPGIGGLLVRRGLRLGPLLFGGGQQGGARPGTPPVALAVGLAEAIERRSARLEELSARWRRLRDRLEAALVKGLGAEGAIRNGPVDEARRLPQTLNVGFPGLDGDALLMGLDMAGVCASLGSACASGAMTPSPTLVAMAVPADRLRSSVRFSLGPETTEAEIDEAARRTIAVVRGAGAE